jgi:hypothetical protein
VPPAPAPVRTYGIASTAPAAPRPQTPPPQAVALDPPRPQVAQNHDGPSPDGFANTPSAPTEALPGVSTPGMLGDLPPFNLSDSGPGGKAPTPAPGSPVIRVPVTTAGGFKIAEGESPRPVDRVFFFYNFFGDINSSINGATSSSLDLHREVFGFEKTILDGDASIGVRVPFFQLAGDPAADSSHFGDLSVIFKYALINDRRTGDVLSTGAVLTAPTGKSLVSAVNPDIHAWLFQPYVGYIYNMDEIYLQGFTSIAVPTDSRDATLLFNDAGIGYRLFTTPADEVITAVVPAFEIHVNTPLNHRGSHSEPVGVPDWVDLTAGCHVGLYHRSTLSIGVCTPVTGPKPFEVEALAQFNLRF